MVCSPSLYGFPANSTIASDDPTIPLFKDISGDTGSMQSSETIKTWLNNCLTTHKTTCSLWQNDRGLSKLPHRVIHVTPEMPRKIRLTHTNGVEGRYACLSHCWGGKQPLRTTLNPDTLLSFQENIREEELPKTFRDAIQVIFALDIQYLWIDSLRVSNARAENCYRFFVDTDDR